MQQVGRIFEIWRYPVSSLRGETLDPPEGPGFISATAKAVIRVGDPVFLV
jgi:hypothetical protein